MIKEGGISSKSCGIKIGENKKETRFGVSFGWALRELNLPAVSLCLSTCYISMNKGE